MNKCVYVGIIWQLFPTKNLVHLKRDTQISVNGYLDKLSPFSMCPNSHIFKMSTQRDWSSSTNKQMIRQYGVVIIRLSVMNRWRKYVINHLRLCSLLVYAMGSSRTAMNLELNNSKF